MKRQEIQIQDGMVFLCGPSATGKSTLAKRIMQEAPFQEKILFSYDDIISNHLVALGYAPSARPGELSPLDLERCQEGISQTFYDAMSTNGFLVCESVCYDPTKLAWILAAFPLCSQGKPLTVIKMLPKMRLQYQFYAKRGFSRDQVIDVMMHRRLFLPASAQGFFAEQYGWVQDYLVEDPRSLEIEYVESGTTTKELEAAKMAYTSFCAGF